MSWDSKALAVIVFIWIMLAIMYATVFEMPTGARAWGAGAVTFLILVAVVGYAEHRESRIRNTHKS